MSGCEFEFRSSRGIYKPWFRKNNGKVANKAEANSILSKTYKVELFSKLFKGSHALTIFAKMLHHRFLTGFQMHP